MRPTTIPFSRAGRHRAVALPALAQKSRPYTDGNVLEVHSVLTKPGMFEEYMKYLAGSYRQEMEELKKIVVVIESASTAPRHGVPATRTCTWW